MPPFFNPFRSKPRDITRPAALLALTIAVLVLFSWVAYTPGASQMFSADPSVKFNTAFCLALSALALFAIDNQNNSRSVKTVALICLCTVGLIAFVTLFEYIFKFNAGIDQLFWKENAQTPFPGRMTIATAVLLLLLSVVQFFLVKRRYTLLVQVVLISSFILLALIFLVNIAQANASNISVFRASTLHTSLAFLLLYIGCFFSYPLSHLKFSFEKRMVANFLFIIVLVTIVFFSFKKTSQRFVETSNLVNHTHEVLLKAKETAIVTTEMQNSIRGYVITGDKSFIPSFNEMAAAALSDVAELKALTKSNALQQVRLDSLQTILMLYVQSRREILTSFGGMTTVDMKELTEKGRLLTSQMRALINSIQVEENQLLAKRNTANKQSISNSSKAMLVFQLVIGLLVILAFAVVYRNARKRKRAEDQMAQLNQELERRVEQKTKEVVEREKQYRLLVENMLEGILVIDFDWRYKLVNQAYLLQRDFPGDSLIGHTLMEKNPGIENTDLFAILQRCMKERRKARFEHVNGKGFYELSIEPVPEGLLILSMDITEKHKAAAQRRQYIEELKNREAQLARAQKIAKLARWEWDIANGVSDEPGELPALLQIVDAASWNTESFFTRMPDEDRRQFQKELQVALENATNLNTEIKILNEAGEIRNLHIVSEIRFDEAGQPAGFTGTVQDVTDLKRSEAMLKQLNVNLEKRAVELNASNLELERFAFVASHDLQEPLRMVSSFLSLLEEETEGQLGSTAKEYIGFAVDGAERMKKLIDALLEYSRLGLNKEGFVEVDSNILLLQVKSMLDLQMRESGAVVHAGPLPVIMGVESQLQRLFLNLISNALKYHSGEQPKIEVGLTEDANEWTFHVKDNGIGIDPKYFEKIFIIFQRLHDKTVYSGTGIGLAICKKIVEKHGGRIWVESAPGCGSTFYFTIPKKSAHHQNEIL